MADLAQESKTSFLSPRSQYHGRLTPEALAFNANLQEFAHRVSFISGLETAGKLSPEQAYEQVKSLWQQLKESKNAMGIGRHLQSETR